MALALQMALVVHREGLVPKAVHEASLVPSWTPSLW